MMMRNYGHVIYYNHDKGKQLSKHWVLVVTCEPLVTHWMAVDLVTGTVAHRCLHINRNAKDIYGSAYIKTLYKKMPFEWVVHNQTYGAKHIAETISDNMLDVAGVDVQELHFDDENEKAINAVLMWAESMPQFKFLASEYNNSVLWQYHKFIFMAIAAARNLFLSGEFTLTSS